MRVNLFTRPSGPGASATKSVPLTLTIQPPYGLPGDYECSMDSAALLRLLRQQTDLPGYVLDAFRAKLALPIGARLTGVELNDTVLTEIGYFID